MNREQWQYASHSLRKLLHKFNEEDTLDRAVEFQFGLKYNPMYGFYNLYDCNLKQSVATIRVDTERTVTRYLDKWMFRDGLLKFKMDDRDSIFIPSQNLSRHDEWVQAQLHNRCIREVQRRVDFLALQAIASSPEVVTYSFPQMSSGRRSPMSLGLSGTSVQETPSHLTVTVNFGHTPSPSETEDIRHKLEQLIHEVRFDEHQVIPVAVVEEHFSGMMRRNADMQRAENAYRELSQEQVRRYAQQLGAYQFRTDTETDSFYGRPVEQLQEYLNTTATGSVEHSLTEEDLVHAVHALDEANVPREAEPRQVREYFRGFQNEYPETATEAEWAGVNSVNIPYMETVDPRDVVIDHPRPRGINALVEEMTTTTQATGSLGVRDVQRAMQSMTDGYDRDTIRRLMNVSED